jgi:hypothetical protein
VRVVTDMLYRRSPHAQSGVTAWASAHGSRSGLTRTDGQASVAVVAGTAR